MADYLGRLEERDAPRVSAMLNTLVRKRQGKIVHLADSSELTSETARKLTVEEKSFYSSIRAASAGFREGVVGGASK